MTDENTTTPACRSCGSVTWVVSWHPDRPEQAICMDCCGTAEHPDGETGHQYEHDPDIPGLTCRYCNAPAPADYDGGWGE